ncbi:MAG: N-acetylmuramoyl-L-alanine amidase [Kiritimatiellia bacterium]
MDAAPNDGEFVVLDPGHGGHDTGARGPRGALEKTMSLDIAARIAGTSGGARRSRKMTRQDDRFVELA